MNRNKRKRFMLNISPLYRELKGCDKYYIEYLIHQLRRYKYER